MQREHALRVAPSRGGRQIASAWRFWAQGDEFYAASRDAAALGKISFHKNFKWQYRLGTTTTRLAVPLRLSLGWLHAVQISFLVEADVLLPLKRADAKVRLIEVPEGSKLVLNVLVSSETRRPVLKPPAEIGGTVLDSDRLRGGASLIVTGRGLKMDANDRSIVADVRDKLRINFTGRPNANEVFAEAAWHEFDARTGNAIAIIPVGFETIQVAHPNAAI